MISILDRKLLKDLYLQKISFDQFCKESQLRGDDNLIEIAVLKKDNELLEYLLSYYYYYGFDQCLCETVQDLLLADWHRQHEEIARILQFKMQCPESIGFLLEAIVKRYDYLFEQDDYYPFVRKCLNAIRSIGGVKAEIALQELKEGTSDEEIKKLAMSQLSKM